MLNLQKELSPDGPTIDDTLGWIYYGKGSMTQR